MDKNDKELYAFKLCSAAAYQPYVARTNPEAADETTEQEQLLKFQVYVMAGLRNLALNFITSNRLGHTAKRKTIVSSQLSCQGSCHVRNCVSKLYQHTILFVQFLQVLFL